MAEYRLMWGGHSVFRTKDMIIVPEDERNKDWLAYKMWLEEGGVPDPPEGDPPPVLP